MFESLSRFLHSSRRSIIVVTITIIVTLIISSLIAIWLSRFAGLNLPSVGTIRTLGVEAYWDINLTNKTETIKWGKIYPGSSQNITLYIRSISNIETTLRLDPTNWNPTSLSDYMNLTWSYNGTTIHPDEIIQVTLILSVSSSFDFINYLIINDVRQFSFDIIISTQE